MSDDLKMLKVDDKWSVSYDAGQNDRPLAWHRYGNLHTPFSEFNADVAMFYGLKDATDSIEALEAKLAKAIELILLCREMQAQVAHREDPLMVLIDTTLAELKGEQP